MSKFHINTLNPEAIQLANIYAVMSEESFGKDLSAKIVGGVKKLEDLMRQDVLYYLLRQKSFYAALVCHL